MRLHLELPLASSPLMDPLGFDAPDELVETQVRTDLQVKATEGWQIVLYNDDHNTFDHVIISLVKVCGHEAEQAEQCAVLVHFKGQCAVKNGDYDVLEPLCTALLERDLTAEIEPT
jgi:ATP-dependent Clp protease adaptor protein ClpS